MELRAQLLILCSLCVARASEVLPSEQGITEFRTNSSNSSNSESLAFIKDLLNTSAQRTNGIDKEIDKSRDKRALGLLLSGLAQIFGYTVTPIQIATLPNVVSAMPLAGQHAAPSRPTSKNITAPNQQEMIKFTGVLNFGNNSNILGHLRRYEQIFHGRGNTTMTTTSPPTVKPVPPAKILVDPRTDSQTKPPLLAPFFVKIPLPIAPELLQNPMPLEDINLSYPAPAITLVNSNENVETPVRKEQKTVYKNNEDSERYTAEDKEIYDQKDVRKPASKYTHQLYIDEPSGSRQRNEESQRQQEERAEKPKKQERQRSREKPTRYRQDEINERHKNREEENYRNRERTSKYKSTDKKKPAHDDEEDEDSAARNEEHSGEAIRSSGSPKRPPEKNDDDKEDYRDGNDDPNKQFSGYLQPENFDKYIEAGYHRQLPIGDYFHEVNPEVIRDSYGEVLDDKRVEDDKLADYISMFKHPYESQEVENPEDESENGKGAVNGYDEHLARLQKLREEYAPPENKYEEYELNDESEADRDDRESERVQNRTSAEPKGPKAGRLQGKNGRAKTSSGSRGNAILRDDAAKPGAAKSQEEIDFVGYTPLIVPVRYVDANDKLQQATTRRLNYKEAAKSASSQSENKIVQTAPTGTPSLQIGLPERPRQLHEGEQKELQIWPPPFDYAYDNTAPVNAIVPPNSPDYPQNYYQHVAKTNAADNANSGKSSQPSGYLVVVGDPAHPYRHPYNIYYYPYEAVKPQNQDHRLKAERTYPRDQIYVPEPSVNQDPRLNGERKYPRDQIYVPQPSVNQDPRLNAERTYPRDQIYVPQPSVNQQFVQASPNFTEYNLNNLNNLNKTTKSPYNYYYQSQEVPDNVLDRYRYIFGDQPEESLNIDVKTEIPNADNWSNRIYRLQSQGDVILPPSPSTLAQLQNVVSSNHNARSRPSQKPRNSQPSRRPRKHSRPEEQREKDETTKSPSRQPIPKTFDDFQSAHDFFGFSKDDYSFEGESSDASKVAEESGKAESGVPVAPEPIIDHYDHHIEDESITKHADELENDPVKAKVKEYRNKVATLKVSEQRQLEPNGPIHYVDFIRNI